MKKTQSKLIKLPRLIQKGDDPAAGLSHEEIEELNVRSYDYARRTAGPQLSDCIISPFSTAIKEETKKKAEASVGLDSQGFFNKRFEDNKMLSNIKFFTAAYQSRTYKNKAVLDTLRKFIEDTVWRNQQGKKIQEVRKIDDQAYVSIEILLNKIKSAREQEKTIFNNIDLSMKDPETDKKIKYNPEITEIKVYFDMNRFANINPETAKGYFKAKSLDKRINAFLKEYTQNQMQKYDVPEERLEQKISFDYELTDGSSVRYLFYPQHSEKHGKIYSELIGKTSKNIAKSTGDLDIIKEIGLTGNYQAVRGDQGIIVTAESRKGKKGEIRIQRLYKDKKQNHTRKYGLYSDAGEIHVKAEDVQANMKMITDRNTTEPTQLKIDTFSAPPAYLQ